MRPATARLARGADDDRLRYQIYRYTPLVMGGSTTSMENRGKHSGERGVALLSVVGILMVVPPTDHRVSLPNPKTWTPMNKSNG